MDQCTQTDDIQPATPTTTPTPTLTPTTATATATAAKKRATGKRAKGHRAARSAKLATPTAPIEVKVARAQALAEEAYTQRTVCAEDKIAFDHSQGCAYVVKTRKTKFEGGRLQPGGRFVRRIKYTLPKAEAASMLRWFEELAIQRAGSAFAEEAPQQQLQRQLQASAQRHWPSWVDTTVQGGGDLQLAHVFLQLCVQYDLAHTLYTATEQWERTQWSRAEHIVNALRDAYDAQLRTYLDAQRHTRAKIRVEQSVGLGLNDKPIVA